MSITCQTLLNENFLILNREILCIVSTPFSWFPVKYLFTTVAQKYVGKNDFRRLIKKGDKRQQPTQCRCLNVYRRLIKCWDFHLTIRTIFANIAMQRVTLGIFFISTRSSRSKRYFSGKPNRFRYFSNTFTRSSVFARVNNSCQILARIYIFDDFSKWHFNFNRHFN